MAQEQRPMRLEREQIGRTPTKSCVFCNKDHWDNKCRKLSNLETTTSAFE
ncbi:hypothetical protein LOAG_14055 [Loa loa]|uniref:Zinc knuckle family protein n=1 Tax=Loa loa TaxID=7209 RepID=A0A1S0TJS5_LOALO|nr:hypothetical protein LOAG_14055 [Loa loa]EFO14465.1 hypothetical protein LOAG_14055 [Loa loa]